MIGLGRTMEIENTTYEVIRTIPITSLKESVTNDDLKQLTEMYHAEKVFKSDNHGQYFFVRAVQDVEWEDIVD